jgi:hypothetical protein
VYAVGKIHARASAPDKYYASVKDRIDGKRAVLSARQSPHGALQQSER